MHKARESAQPPTQLSKVLLSTRSRVGQPGTTVLPS